MWHTVERNKSRIKDNDDDDDDDDNEKDGDPDDDDNQDIEDDYRSGNQDEGVDVSMTNNVWTRPDGQRVTLTSDMIFLSR